MLFFKECKRIMFSLTFILFLAGFLCMYSSQYLNDTSEKITPPLKNRESYGMIAKEDPQILMPAAVESLVSNYSSNRYTAYPFGFYKEVKLRDSKKREMEKVVTELTGMTPSQLKEASDSQETQASDENDNTLSVQDTQPVSHVTLSKDISYDRFCELMTRADDIIGGGSDYAKSNLVNNFSLVPATYEDALEEYNTFLNTDKVYSAYARYYCDYVSIPLTILPVFICTALFLRDKKYKTLELVYSRKITSSKIILVRYFAVVSMTLIPVIITSIISVFRISALYPELKLSVLPFFVTAAEWLIPAVLFMCALSVLITLATGSALSIAAGCALWIISLFSKIGTLVGGTKVLTLLIRHNSLFDSKAFTDSYNVFAANRIIYTALSAAAVFAAIAVYELKRKGKFYESKSISIHHQNKSAS